MRIVLTSQAGSDIEEAVGYYKPIEPRLGLRFIDEVDSVFDRIRTFPMGSPPVEGFKELRRARMRHFPYGLFYETTEADDLLVVRVLHSRRHRPNALKT